MLNKAALHQVIASVRNLDIPFDMSTWDFCVHGHIERIWPNLWLTEIAKFFGITEDQMNEMIWPEGWSNSSNFSRQDAINMLERLIVTGEVRWSPIPPPTTRLERFLKWLATI